MNMLKKITGKMEQPPEKKSEDELRLDSIANGVAKKMANEELEKQIYITGLYQSRAHDVTVDELEKRINKHIRYPIQEYLGRVKCTACGTEANYKGVCLGCCRRVIPEEAAKQAMKLTMEEK